MELNNTQYQIGYNHGRNVTMVKGKKILGYVFAGAMAVLSVVGGNAILNPPSNGYTLERSNKEYNVKNTGNVYNYLLALGVAVFTIGAAVGIHRNFENKMITLEDSRDKQIQIETTKQIMEKQKIK